MNEHNLCRWGFLSTAGIARKNWQSIWHAPSATLTAVASRSAEKSQAFIDECQAEAAFDPPPRALASYEELTVDPAVDAIYLPLPTGLRCEWAVKVAEAGKHVMMEKPCGANEAELQAVIDACAANGVQFMDGIMFMHSDRLPRLRAVLDDGKSVGEIRRLNAQFSFAAGQDFLDNNIRLDSRLEPMGCLGDLGWYLSRIFMFAMNWQMPDRVQGRLLQVVHRGESPAPVPVEFSGDMFWDKANVTAAFYCSFVAENQQWLHVSGTKGYLQIPDFVLPFYGACNGFEVSNHQFKVSGTRFNMLERTRTETVDEYSDGAAGAQETKLFETFSQLALKGQPDPFWPDLSIKTQRLLDALLASARAHSTMVDVS